MAHALRPTVIYSVYSMRKRRQKLLGRKKEKGTKRKKAENGDGKKGKSNRQGQKVRSRERERTERENYTRLPELFFAILHLCIPQ